MTACAAHLVRPKIGARRPAGSPRTPGRISCDDWPERADAGRIEYRARSRLARCPLGAAPMPARSAQAGRGARGVRRGVRRPGAAADLRLGPGHRGPLPGHGDSDILARYEKPAPTVRPSDTTRAKTRRRNEAELEQPQTTIDPRSRPWTSRPSSRPPARRAEGEPARSRSVPPCDAAGRVSVHIPGPSLREQTRLAAGAPARRQLGARSSPAPTGARYGRPFLRPSGP
jgi:hypothetical protein